MKSIVLEPPKGPLAATVTLPGSKSQTNRALTAASLAGGGSLLSGALFADDTRRMIGALRGLGFAVTDDPQENRIEITGRGGHIPAGDASIDCGNSGTTIRFCTALASLGQGRYRFDGIERMRERPIGHLVEALRVLGAGVEYHAREGYPPLTVHARGLAGGFITLDRLDSSQYLSALLMAVPSAGSDVLIDVNGPLPSAPYVNMTIAVMSSFGPAVIADVGPAESRFIIPAPQHYQPTNYAIEPDASNASYFLAAPAVAGGEVTVMGLGTSSVQGDAAFVNVLERMGCGVKRGENQLTVRGPERDALRAIDIDLNAMPDMVQTVAVLAMYADGVTTIRNVGNLRVKETDRLAALVIELGKLGATVQEEADGLRIQPPKSIARVAVDTYNDHRMAMSFALAGLSSPGVRINDPGCVDKTFPDFFERWGEMTASAGH